MTSRREGPLVLAVCDAEGNLVTVERRQEFQALLGLCPGNRLEVSEGGWKHVYRWVDELP